MKPKRSFLAGVRRSASGFSLIEMVMVIVISGIILAAGMPMLGELFEGMIINRDLAQYELDLRVAMERVIRETRSATTGSFIPASGSSSTLNFTDGSGNSLTFTFNSGTRQLFRGNDVIANNIGTCTFTVTGDAVTITMTSSTLSSNLATLRTTVYARND